MTLTVSYSGFWISGWNPSLSVRPSWRFILVVIPDISVSYLLHTFRELQINRSIIFYDQIHLKRIEKVHHICMRMSILQLSTLVRLVTRMPLDGSCTAGDQKPCGSARGICVVAGVSSVFWESQELRQDASAPVGLWYHLRTTTHCLSLHYHDAMHMNLRAQSPILPLHLGGYAL